MTIYSYSSRPLLLGIFFHYNAPTPEQFAMARRMLHPPSDNTGGAAIHGTDAEEQAFLAIEVVLGSRFVHKIDAAPGFNAMELIRAAGLPIKAECGGAGVCATCHCRVPQEWAARLPAPSDDELGKLDEIPDADDRSRLSCQIQMTDDLDGLVLELQEDSLVGPHLQAAE